MDAVDKYQITSDNQRKVISEIVTGQRTIETRVNSSESASVKGTAVESMVEEKIEENKKSDVQNDSNNCEKEVKICSCGNNSQNVSGVFDQLLVSLVSGQKAKIKIEIEVTKD